MYRLLPGAVAPAGMGAPAMPALAAAALRPDPNPAWQRLTLILGGPRSGTTWLAKIFDSHPGTLYRHEPDTVLRNPALPLFVEPGDVAGHAVAARAWAERLLDIRSLKVSASLPAFRKRYLPWPARWLRRGGSVGLRLLEHAPGPLRRDAHRLSIPDFVNWRGRGDVHLVLKSVSARGRAALLAAALPGSSVVFLLRHPCGSIASELRGDAEGLFERRWDAEEMLRNPLASGYGLDAARLRAMPQLEQRAWNWVLANEIALRSLTPFPRVRLVRYQDLCARPEPMARALFDFAGLDWHRQTADFLRRSTTHRGPTRYYGVFRNTLAEAERWRQQMPLDRQQRIMAVIGHSPLAALFPEPQIG